MKINPIRRIKEIETIFSELINDTEKLIDICVASEETSSLAKDIIGLKLKAELGKKLLSDLKEEV